MKKNWKKTALCVLLAALVLSLAGCNVAADPAAQAAETAAQTATPASNGAAAVDPAEAGTARDTVIAATSQQLSGSALETDSLFTKRDLTQTPDLSEAETHTVQSGETYTVTAAGVYVLQGSAENATVVVDAGDEDKVQLVLDGLHVTNEDFPCIYVKNADKVFLTTTDGDNSLAVTGSFRADGETNTDAVIFSRDDLVLNGLGTLTISSTDNGVSCKDDLKITGGTLTVSCVSDGLEANDSIRIADGVITVSTPKDGLHAENDEDYTLGYVYIGGGTLNITAGDDGIHATTVVQLDGGSLTISAAEGIEGTWVQLNGGTVSISASDDGINGARKSSAYTVAVEINGGTLTIVMGAGDTDGIDSNGNLYITGGTIDITGQSPFDYDGQASYTGGTIVVNGVETNEITNQFGGMGGPGGGMGGPGGGMGGMGGPGQGGGMGGPGQGGGMGGGRPFH